MFSLSIISSILKLLSHYIFSCLDNTLFFIYKYKLTIR